MKIPEDCDCVICQATRALKMFKIAQDPKSDLTNIDEKETD
jgi:hypothetical protein